MRASLGLGTGVVLDVPRQSRPAGQRRRADHARGLRDDRPRPVCADHDAGRDGVAPPSGSSDRGRPPALRQLDTRGRTHPAARSPRPAPPARAARGPARTGRSRPRCPRPPPPRRSAGTPSRLPTRRASPGWAARPDRGTPHRGPLAAARAPPPARRTRRRPASATTARARARPPRGRPARGRRPSPRPPRRRRRSRRRRPRLPPVIRTAAARVFARSRVARRFGARGAGHRHGRDRHPMPEHRADLRHGPQVGAGEQRTQLDARVRPLHGHRAVVAREPVARDERQPGTRGDPVAPGADEVVDDDAQARDAPRLPQERDRVAGLEVVHEQRGVDDVERPVGPRAARAHRSAAAPGPPSRPAADRSRRAASITSGRESVAVTRRMRCRRTPSAISASGMSAAPVPTSSSVCGTVRRPSSRSSATVDARVPPDQRLIRARSRRLPRRTAGSSSGPSRSSRAPASRRIAAA